MAACSFAQIGALNAESFCERVLSCANLVIDKGNTMLHDDEIEKVVTLRMNRKFMECMRTEYLRLARPAGTVSGSEEVPDVTPEFSP